MQQQISIAEELVIQIRGLYKSFGENHVLRGINLDLANEETLVVLGRSGTGKSVLIKIIAGLLQADSGEVIVLGQNLRQLDADDLRELRLHIGFSFQSSALYDSMTVRENLEFPLIRNHRQLTKNQVSDAVEEVLSAVGLIQTINQMPAELSGGQRKRIGIARTLILKPRIMLYDEPTAGLDPTTSLEINKLIRSVREKYKTSSIVITHDLACARNTGDRVAMLLDGTFVREGSFDEVFKSDDERIQSFYNYNFIQ
jgi:phospholipid/cholesterol/gamma-HCH transport system ATP-binding protein